MRCKPRLQGKAGLRERMGRTTDSQKELGVESECRVQTEVLSGLREP